MTRHPHRRGRLLAAATATVLAATCAVPVAWADTTTPGPVTAPITLPAETVPASIDPGQVVDVSSTGVLHGSYGNSYAWTDFASGTTTQLALPSGAGNARYAGNGLVAFYANGTGGTPLVFQSLSDGSRRTACDCYVYGAFAGKALVSNQGRGLALASPDGTLTPVAVPAGAVFSTSVWGGGDNDHMMMGYEQDGAPHYLWINADGSTSVIDASSLPGTGQFAVGDGKLVFLNAAGDVRVFDAGDVTAPPVSVTLSLPGRSRPVGVVGDNLIVATSGGAPGFTLSALPLNGGPGQSLGTGYLAAAAPLTDPESPDGKVVVAQPSASGTTLRVLTAATDGSVDSTALADFPTATWRPDALALANGELTTAYTSPYTPDRSRMQHTELPVDAAGTTGSTTSLAASLPQGDALFASANGSPVVVNAANGDIGAGAGSMTPTGLSHLSDVQVAGSTEAFSGLTSAGTRVIQVGTGVDTDQLPFKTFALSATTLWTQTAPGTVTGVNLNTSPSTAPAPGTFHVADCPLSVLRANGPWIYWACATADGGAGVYNTVTRTSVPVPWTADGDTALGDGFVATASGSTLSVTDVTSGTAQTRKVADLVDPVLGQGWTVDPYGGGIAYSGSDGTVHVVPSGVSPSDVALYGQTTTGVRSAGTAWQGTWQVTRPIASWTLTVTSVATGRVVSTVTGGPARAQFTAQWDGTEPGITRPSIGPYTWRITAQPADGRGPDATTTGTTLLPGGAPAFHDFQSANGLQDTFGDIVVRTSATTFSFKDSTGNGSFIPLQDKSTWPAGTTVVPFGPLRDRNTNDMLVRTPSGDLRVYSALYNGNAYTDLGTGWNQFKWLGYTGDVNGDGYPDLLAWSASNGNLYLYPGTAQGRFGARVLLRNGLAYTKLIAVGDVTGDGVGDLLAYDHLGNLWLMTGNGKGDYAARKEVFADWGQAYNTIIGVGDVTGDGKADLLERDSAGNVWVNPGRGNGTFGARIKAGAGWQNYLNLY
ncbi:FG-GAP-like repeat-containing protein [Streptomyces sp. NPDC001852]|uniref:FG-GAP-like repeat-containing protein n=1 Tax=Streptomyces sp. NPDC001852 TaxID=3364619 RepID=UPI00368FB3FE